MTTTADRAAIIRNECYRLGVSLRASAAGKRAAIKKAGDLEYAYPATKYGITFYAGQIPGSTEWGVYATGVPVLGYRENLTQEAADLIVKRLRDWEDMVLVREFKKSGRAREVAYRMNQDLKDLGEPATEGPWHTLSAAGTVFKSQASGIGGRLASVHGVYAMVPKELASVANLKEVATDES